MPALVRHPIRNSVPDPRWPPAARANTVTATGVDSGAEAAGASRVTPVTFFVRSDDTVPGPGFSRAVIKIHPDLVCCVRAGEFAVGSAAMTLDEERTQLRVAVYGADGAAVVALLQRNKWPDHALQLIGDGVLLALDQDVPGASGLAEICVELLDERRWDGDRELAVELLARLGKAPAPLLKPLPVDLEELGRALEGDPVESGGRLDITSGEVWPLVAIEYAREKGEEDEDASDDPDRYLWIDGMGSRPGYRDMEDFIEALDDAGKADRLRIAIEGRGAFRRFKNVLDRWPEDFTRWYAFSEDRQRGRAREWLTAEGYRATLPSFDY